MNREVITPEHLEAYRRDGFFILRAVCAPEEVESFSSECRRLWQDLDPQAAEARVQFRDQEDGNSIADRIDPLLDVSPVFRQLVQSEALRRIAAGVLGEEATIFKAKLIMKRPGTMGYGLHQDYPYWKFMGIPAEEYVIVVVALDESRADNGAMEMFPGLHRGRIAADSKGDHRDANEALVDLQSGVFLDLNPGDVGVFHSYTPHRSGPNRSERSRRNLYFTYVPAIHGAQVLERYYQQSKVLH